MTEVVDEDYDSAKFEFLDLPEEKLTCSGCSRLLFFTETYVAFCCGSLRFCQRCYNATIASKKCPRCKGEANWRRNILDEATQDRMKVLKIQCPRKERGCEWIGEVGSLEEHLDITSGDCRFASLECSYCEECIERNKLENHKKICIKRPYQCEYCELRSTYEDVTEHYNTCGRYPLPCPNDCGLCIGTIERRYLQEHLDKDCPLQKLGCEFRFAGCTGMIKRKDMPDHIKGSKYAHLRQMAVWCSKHNRESQTELEKKKREIVALQEQIHSQQAKINLLQSISLHMKTVAFTPPLEFRIIGFRGLLLNDREWFSPHFYSHSGGYKLCISVRAHSYKERKGAYLALLVYIMRGEFDENIKWPFHGNVTVELQNQAEPILHNRRSIHFNDRTPSEVCSRVLDSDMSSQGWGCMSRSFDRQCVFDVSENNKHVAYVKDDSMYIQIQHVQIGLE